MKSVDTVVPDTGQSEDSFRPRESHLDETWMATMMRNMKRMAEDDNRRREIARQLS